MLMQNEQYILRPQVPLPGCLAQIIPMSQVKTFYEIESQREQRLFIVRAVIGENVPLGLDIPRLLSLQSDSLMSINGGPLTIYLHHSGLRATFYDLVPKTNGELSHIDVHVEADHPDAAIGPARTAVNQFLDALMREVWLPLTIVRLDVFSATSEMPLMHELHYPFLIRLNFGPMGGYDSFPLLAEYEALAREAILATSPYYRFSCAFRLCEAVGHFRSQIRKFVEEFNVSTPVPKPPDIDGDLALNFGFTPEFSGNLRKFNDLIAQFAKFRNAVSHPLTKKFGEKPLHLSDGYNYRLYAGASSLMLHYAHLALDELRIFFNVHVSPHLFRGSILPEIGRRQDFVIKASSIWPNDAT